MRFFDRVTERTENYIRSYVIGKLHRKRSRYRLLYRNDMARLQRVLRPGDVILIEGEHWVSDWIKVFSYHTWTHCVLWVGSSPPLSPAVNPDFVEPGGNILEALMTHGVILSNLEKYRPFNLRICRPVGITRDQLRRAIRYATDRVGCPYDELNVSQFVHFTFSADHDPTTAIGLLHEDKFTCSSLIAAAFASVNLPVIHFYDEKSGEYVPFHATQVQPKDFDLSLNFQVIKTPALLPQMRHVSSLRRLFGLGTP